MARAHAGAAPRGTRRGRPFKFGRPARVVVLSLPEDVVTWLESIHHDLAWAIVTLFDQRLPTRRPARRDHRPSSMPAELVALAGRRGLIVVQPQQLQKLEGVSLIPLPDGRAFLALEPLKGLADLELAVIDRLASAKLSREKRAQLETFRDQLRRWRRTPGLRFRSRSIILAERVDQNAPAPRRRRP
jgi:hypothetical protein